MLEKNIEKYFVVSPVRAITDRQTDINEKIIARMQAVIVQVC